MKHKHIVSVLEGALLSFLLSIGVAGSVATGLTLPAKLPMVVLCCGLWAVFCSLCLYWNAGWLSVAAMVLSQVLLPMRLQLITIVTAVLRRLNLAYGFPIPDFFLDNQTSTVWFALLLMGGIGGYLAARAVIKGSSCLPAALAAVLPLCSCITVVDSVPGRPWLFLWALGLLLLVLTQGLRRQDPTQGRKLTALLALPTAAMLLFLFWLVPPDAPDKWAFGDLPERILAYFQTPESVAPPVPPTPTPQVDLSTLANPVQSSDVIMRVTAEEAGTMYLRGRDYDRYTGTQWEASEPRMEFIGNRGGASRGTVTIETPVLLDHLYTPSFTLQRVTLRNGYVENPYKQTSYEFHWLDPLSRSIVIIAGDANGLQTGSMEVDPGFLELDDQTRSAALAYLEAHGVDLKGSNIRAQAEQICTLVKNSATYDLNTPPMPPEEQDLAMWFLESSDTGYCVHFATATTVLLRAAGIPARYVQGYLIETKANQTVPVTEKQAHAWVEYYMPSLGWELLEATPAASESEEPTEPPVPQPTEPVPDSGKGETIWLYGAAVLLAVLVFLLQYALRRYWFQQRCHRGLTNRRALALYRRGVRLSTWLKQPIPPELTELARKARFSQHTLTLQELQLLSRWLRNSESQVSKLPLFKRLAAKWVFAYY